MRIGLIIIRLFSLGLAIVVFGWFNVFSMIVQTSAGTNYYSQMSTLIGLLYAILICLSFIKMTKNIFRVYRFIYVVLSFVVLIFLLIDLLFSIIFSQNIIFFINLFFISTLTGNTLLVLENNDVFVGIRQVILVAIIFYLLGLFWLSTRWVYFSEIISCSGTSMTTTGSYEKWSYKLPRLQCWKMQLY